MLHSAIDIAHGDTRTWLESQRPSRGGVRFRHRHGIGEPEMLVSAFVESHDVDLIVVEEPPRDFVSEALWRSFAERLVRCVPCPVVIGGPGFLRDRPSATEPIASPLPRGTIADLLNAMVDARTEALCTWMDHVARAVEQIARSQDVAAISRPVTGWQNTTMRLNVSLEEHRLALGALRWQLTRGDRTWGNGRIDVMPGSGLDAFKRRVASAGASTSLPLPLEGSGDDLMILAGATVGEDGMLVLAFDAETDFLRILGQPGPVPSFETYAFDRDGVMLSNSRYPEHLAAAGLLPQDDCQTPLRVRVAEPTAGPLDTWPLTLMVRQAVARGDGWNTRGYPDYRGVSVVGAWRWVERYGFGVAAEVDLEAASN